MNTPPANLKWQEFHPQINIPRENVPVWTKIDDGKGVRNVQIMWFRSKMFFTGPGDDAMYVYYCPTHFAYEN